MEIKHCFYGCESGCCGHQVTLADGTERFFFEHPWSMTDQEFVDNLAGMMGVETVQFDPELHNIERD